MTSTRAERSFAIFMRARRASIVLLLAVLLAPCRASTTCETAPRTPRDRRLRPESSLLAVAAFNARWLFDGVDEPSTSPYFEDVSGARAHVDAVRDVVREVNADVVVLFEVCLLYTSPSPRDKRQSRMPSSA